MFKLGYQVMAGAPKFLDSGPERDKVLKEVMSEAAFQQLMKGTGDVFVPMEERFFEVKPPAVIVADRAFWKPKSSSKGSTPVGIPCPPEQKPKNCRE